MNISRLSLIAFSALFLPQHGSAGQPAPPVADSKPGNSMVTALQFAHQFGQPDALLPGKDGQLKVALIAALSGSPDLAWSAVSNAFDKDAYRKLAGDAAAIPVAKMEAMLRATTPASRKSMNTKVRQHAMLLATQFDMIGEGHREPAEQLTAWIVKNYQPGKPLGIIAICTGNTRRSMISATMGNLAAAYYGLPDIRFYSGGTTPDAINPRTIATLKEIGVEIEPSGREAVRGEAGRANPIYRVKWGQDLETLEFSKKYNDSHNPKDGFAALLVCSEADAACPNVLGAAARIPIPYLDPKAFDGAEFEAAKYAERRDDIGRFMLSVLMQAHRRLELDGKLK